MSRDTQVDRDPSRVSLLPIKVRIPHGVGPWHDLLGRRSARLLIVFAGHCHRPVLEPLRVDIRRLELGQDELAAELLAGLNPALESPDIDDDLGKGSLAALGVLQLG
jgi:hypothetical protein